LSRRGWVLFGAASLVWGLPYLFIKVAVNQGLTPGFIAWSRVTVAAVVLVPVAANRGSLRRLPVRGLLLFSLAEIAVPFPLIAFGEEHISSSLTAILIATEPLAVVTLALCFAHAERPTPTRLVGMLIGVAGVVALVGVDIGGRGDELLGVTAVLVATLGYAGGALIVQRSLSQANRLGCVSAAMAISSLLLLPLAVRGAPQNAPSPAALAAVAVLGLVCSALAFVLFFGLIAEVGPSRATVITYLNPAVALALGAAVLGEEVTATAVGGLGLVLAGSWLATSGRLPKLLRRVMTTSARGSRPQEVRP
jgi:drug/metabolite transporter (DMT)-like permease